MLFAGAASMAAPRPLLLLNTTPSEPIGVYVASFRPLRTGDLVAFHAPAGAFPYADAHLPYLRRQPLLKALAAGPGDFVCTVTGRLSINGQDRAAIASIDSRGAPVPRWRACRQLGRFERFAFSDRVSNSFDSRYFGPVPEREILGVYKPLFVRAGTP